MVRSLILALDPGRKKTVDAETLSLLDGETQTFVESGVPQKILTRDLAWDHSEHFPSCVSF